MIDRKTEADIKSLKDFLEVWGKFHSLYEDVIKKDIISKDDEEKFLETKGMVRKKYEDLKSLLDFKYEPHSRLTDPAGDILAFDNIRFVSEKILKKMGEDWRDSYIFLNNIQERLELKKRRLSEFNPVGVFLKRVLERR